MIDLENEPLISLQEAAEHLPRGHNGNLVSVRTIGGWIRKGHGGVRLEVVKVGQKARATTVAACHRFIAALNSRPVAGDVECGPRVRVGVRPSTKERLRKMGF